VGFFVFKDGEVILIIFNKYLNTIALIEPCDYNRDDDDDDDDSCDEDEDWDWR